MRFLSSNVIKGEYLCYCNVETKFYVKKRIKTKKKKKKYNISFFKISFLRPLVLKETYTKLYHEEKKFAGYIAQF